MINLPLNNEIIFLLPFYRFIKSVVLFVEKLILKNKILGKVQEKIWKTLFGPIQTIYRQPPWSDHPSSKG